MVKHLFEHPGAPDLPKSLTLPEPPKSLRRQRWLVTIGLFILAVSSPITGLVAYQALNSAEETAVLAEDAIRLAETNIALSSCRAELANQVGAAESDVDAQVAAIVRAAVLDASPEFLRKAANELDRRISVLDDAQKRRNNVEEICGEDA